MRTIFKYDLPESDNVFKICMNRGAKVLCVQVQNHIPRIWAEIDTEEPQEPFWFFVVGTGCKRPEEAQHYIGTWQQNGYVWHLYSEEKETF